MCKVRDTQNERFASSHFTLHWAKISSLPVRPWFEILFATYWGSPEIHFHRNLPTLSDYMPWNFPAFAIDLHRTQNQILFRPFNVRSNTTAPKPRLCTTVLFGFVEFARSPNLQKSLIMNVVLNVKQPYRFYDLPLSRISPFGILIFKIRDSLLQTVEHTMWPMSKRMFNSLIKPEDISIT